MSASIIQLATAKGTKYPFVFHEGCPECGKMVAPFIVKGRSTGRFVCHGDSAMKGPHDPVHWNETPDNWVQASRMGPQGYEITPRLPDAVS